MEELDGRPFAQLSLLELELVTAILRRQLPGVPVWVFGSRATGDARTFSDLDLAVGGEKAPSLAKRAELVEAFEESDLPFRVDLVNLASVDPAFARRVRQTGRLWPGLEMQIASV